MAVLIKVGTSVFGITCLGFTVGIYGCTVRGNHHSVLSISCFIDLHRVVPFSFISVNVIAHSVRFRDLRSHDPFQEVCTDSLSIDFCFSYITGLEHHDNRQETRG